MIFFPFLLAFLIGTGVSPLVIWLYKKKNWIDDPKKNTHAKTLHSVPVPRGGGIVIFVSAVLASLVFIPFSLQLSIILIGAAVLTLIGILDDIGDLSPYLRFAVGIFVALLIAVGGINIQYITHPFQPGVLYFDHPSITLSGQTYSFSLPFLSIILTVLWIVWNMNIVNWSKGVDGQLPGVVAIASACIGVLSLRFISDPQQHMGIILSFIVSGAFLGFLVWNAYPQKIMPGYGAGSLGGYFLAILSMLSGSKLATALLVLALPTADALFTIMRRLLNKKSPFWGDRGHLHHKLIDVLGWSKRTTALFYWLTTALMGIIALQLKSGQKVFTILVVTALVFGFLIWAKLFITSSKRHDHDNG